MLSLIVIVERNSRRRRGESRGLAQSWPPRPEGLFTRSVQSNGHPQTWTKSKTHFPLKCISHMGCTLLIG